MLFHFLSSFSIKQVLLFVIHSGVLPFSRHLFKCVIIFTWIFVNSLMQNPRTLSGLHAFHFGSLRNCCLNLTASIMISTCFLLSLKLYLTSLIYSALSLCSTFWDNIAPKFSTFFCNGFHIILSSFSLSFQTRVLGWIQTTCFVQIGFFHHTSEAWWF